MPALKMAISPANAAQLAAPSMIFSDEFSAPIVSENESIQMTHDAEPENHAAELKDNPKFQIHQQDQPAAEAANRLLPKANALRRVLESNDRAAIPPAIDAFYDHSGAKRSGTEGAVPVSDSHLPAAPLSSSKLGANSPMPLVEKIPMTLAALSAAASLPFWAETPTPNILHAAMYGVIFFVGFLGYFGIVQHALNKLPEPAREKARAEISPSMNFFKQLFPYFMGAILLNLAWKLVIGISIIQPAQIAYLSMIPIQLYHLRAAHTWIGTLKAHPDALPPAGYFKFPRLARLLVPVYVAGEILLHPNALPISLNKAFVGSSVVFLLVLFASMPWMRILAANRRKLS